MLKLLRIVIVPLFLPGLTTDSAIASFGALGALQNVARVEKVEAAQGFVSQALMLDLLADRDPPLRKNSRITFIKSVPKQPRIIGVFPSFSNIIAYSKTSNELY